MATTGADAEAVEVRQEDGLVTAGGAAACGGAEAAFERLPCHRQDEDIACAAARSDGVGQRTHLFAAARPIPSRCDRR